MLHNIYLPIYSFYKIEKKMSVYTYVYFIKFVQYMSINGRIWKTMKN